MDSFISHLFFIRHWREHRFENIGKQYAVESNCLGGGGELQEAVEGL
jgi:hypothetical protein